MASVIYSICHHCVLHFIVFLTCSLHVHHDIMLMAVDCA